MAPAGPGRHPATTGRGSAPSSGPARGLLLFLAALVWLRLVSPPEVAADLGADPSWQRALVYFFRAGLAPGSDWLFPYGPLGFLVFGSFHPDLFLTRVLLVELLAKGGIALVLAGLAWRRGVFGGLAVAYLLFVPMGPDAVHPLALLALAAFALLFARSEATRRMAAAGIAAIGLLKFSFFALAIPALVALPFVSPAGTPSRRGRILTAVTGLLALLALWLAAGASFSDLRPWLAGSLELSAGYSRTMAMPVREGATAAALGVAALTLAALVLAAREEGGAAAWIARGLAVLGLAIAFKTSFVRHAGSGAYFELCALVALLFGGSWSGGGDRRPGRLLVAGAVGVALGMNPWVPELGLRAPVTFVRNAARPIAQKVALFLRPLAVREELEARRRRFRQEHDLARVREVVGSEAVDVVGSAEAIAIVNDLSYRPRPIFQSYAAYTPALMARNAAAFASPASPRFVLFRPEAIDGRFPTLADGLVLRQLAKRYAPRLRERGFLLLERRSPPAPIEERPILERSVRPGEWIELPEVDLALVAQVKVEPSWIGQLRALLYQLPPLRLEWQDRSGGARRTASLPTPMGEAGFLLAPELESVDDWLRAYRERPGPDLRRFRVLLPPNATAWFEPRVQVSVSADAGLFPEPSLP